MHKRMCLLLSVLLLTACSRQDMLHKFSISQDQAVAKGYIDQLIHRNFDPIEAAMDPSIRRPSLHQTLERMAALVPAEAPLSVKLVGASTLHTSKATTVNSTFEYQFKKRWLLINVAVQRAGSGQTIVGFHVVPRSESLEAENRFTLAGKGAAQYGILGAAILASILTLYALVACIRTRLRGRKWPWILFIVFGLGRFWVNWTTGQLGIQPISIQLFSAGASAQLYGPWLISAAVPLGAIVFLIRRQHLKHSASI